MKIDTPRSRHFCGNQTICRLRFLSWWRQPESSGLFRFHMIERSKTSGLLCKNQTKAFVQQSDSRCRTNHKKWILLSTFAYFLCKVTETPPRACILFFVFKLRTPTSPFIASPYPKEPVSHFNHALGTEKEKIKGWWGPTRLIAHPYLLFQFFFFRCIVF